jgi:predicted molibdopterin-dependent oxidoreductase YjgC
VHPDLGFAEGVSVLVSSKYGSCQLRVANSGDLRPDCLLIHANTLGVNHLTPALVSQEGENACYQEVKVRVEAL